MNRHTPTITQVSAGGVAYRRQNGKTQVVLISVGNPPRWQLPKGRIEDGETRQTAAQREVREEAGLETELLDSIGNIEYWFYTNQDGEHIRIHKYVYFYLMRYQSGDPAQHDDEVHKAGWQEIKRAFQLLAFDNEKEIVKKASRMIEEIHEN
jgi:8-oxo-dGTP diphosphatase